MSTSEPESSSEEFSEFTLEGTRFDGGRLPVDALVELERYRELLLAAAIRAWHRQNPSEELPTDFETDFDLAITEVRDGSARSVLERPESQYGEYFDLGRDEVEQLFREIVAGVALPLLNEPTADAETVADADGSRLLGEEVTDGVARPAPTLTRDDLIAYGTMPAFRDLGTSLRSGESTRISNPESEAPVEIDTSVRDGEYRDLVARIDEVLTPPVIQTPVRRHDLATIAGRLIALSPERMNYTVRTLLHGEVNGRYKKPELTEDLKAVLDSSALAPVVRLTGTVSWVGDRLEKIIEAVDVELLEVAGESWSRRIIELASLPAGWSDETSTSSQISFAALDAAKAFLAAVQNHQSVAPGIFPLESGGVELEWTRPPTVTSVEISGDDVPEFAVHSFTLDPRSSMEVVTTNYDDALAAILEAMG